MGAPIPKPVQETSLTNFLHNGLDRIAQGKVRDNFNIDDNHLLMVASDRISIFDFVLNARIKDKGELLTALTIYIYTKVLNGIDHHLLAYGTEIDRFLSPKLQNIKDLQKRAFVVKKLEMLPIECIVRGWLTGSGLKDYNNTGIVSGHTLQEGLHDGSQLPLPIFSPSTKAVSGHDENIDYLWVRKEFGMIPEQKALEIYMQVRDFCQNLGIILADFKIELSKQFILADEISPDACRFWLKSDWDESQKRKMSPNSYDKDVVRTWGKTVKTPFRNKKGSLITGINNLNPENGAHLFFVHQLVPPQDVLDQTSERYHEIFEILTDLTLTQFQTEVMRIVA